MPKRFVKNVLTLQRGGGTTTRNLLVSLAIALAIVVVGLLISAGV
jgi:hypothetical protein